MRRRPYQNLSGEELRRRSKRADNFLGSHVERVRMSDPAFRAALDDALELEAEIEARKNR